MSNIIGIGYKARSGKDTAAEHIANNYNYKQESFAAPLKAAVKVLFDLTDEQVYGDEKMVVDERYGKTPAELMQAIGSAARSVHEDVFVIGLFSRMGRTPDTSYVVSDVRYVNEADALKDIGATLIKVNRNDRGDTGRDDSHPSEAELDAYDGFDHVIDNNDSMDAFLDRIDYIM